jgi:hypothetical protein
MLRRAVRTGMMIDADGGLSTTLSHVSFSLSAHYLTLFAKEKDRNLDHQIYFPVLRIL